MENKSWLRSSSIFKKLPELAKKLRQLDKQFIVLLNKNLNEKYKIVLLSGDGIGPEISEVSKKF